MTEDATDQEISLSLQFLCREKLSLEVKCISSHPNPYLQVRFLSLSIDGKWLLKRTIPVKRVETSIQCFKRSSRVSTALLKWKGECIIHLLRSLNLSLTI